MHFSSIINNMLTLSIHDIILLLDFIRAHAAELGNEVPSEPLLFLKPTTSYLKEGGKIIVRILKLYVS